MIVMFNVTAQVTRGKRRGEKIQFQLKSATARKKVDALINHLDSDNGIFGLRVIEVKRV